tara:strand:- start:326 stop:559 length:234 start_codon:yes stop_codon:yes gene_type:complete
VAVLFDFRCSKGHIHERITDSSVISVQCPVCGEQAFKIISAVNFSLDPISGHFPSATDKWAKHREIKIKEERKQANS